MILITTACTTKHEKNVLQALDSLLEQKNNLTSKKWNKIESLNQQLWESEQKKEITYQYQICSELSEEYKSFQYDSAFKYTKRMLSLGYILNDPKKINEAKINISFILLSSGMFKEALDTLITIDSMMLSKEARIRFYKVFARTYFDLADFSQDQFYTQVYSKKGDKYLRYAISICDKNTAEYFFLKAWEYMRIRNIREAINTYEKLLNQFVLTEHEKAIVASSLSFMHRLDNNMEKTKEYLAKAAMCDVRASIRETVALRDLAELLFREKNYETAYRYIKIAQEDASFYGAKFRKVQIANILPVIESAHMNEVEAKRKQLTVYSLLATLVALLIIGLTIVIYMQNRKLVAARAELLHSHNELKKLNTQLLDSNKIKDEYIGHFFKTISEYIDKIEKFKNSVDRKIAQRNLDHIRDIVNRINLKNERDELYKNFDKIFLKIFPNFVSKINSLLKDEDRYVINENDSLPPEIRIYALIRLGITDNEKIAQFLGYSVNTIYTYKTRVKNKANIPNDQLESVIMEIPSV
ncbi:MAG: helix-turn-helix transcriptional regulator [Cytophagaceae bacterium]|nr:helix-turn-helix transcriptional regulator [Cytophagaceae bacterium]MDW8455899.1 DUF6377 domain-containing protein [Cytophagaceae bacterium]